MCGIVGSKDYDKALEIVDLVKERGTRAWSHSLIDLEDLSLSTYVTGDREFEPNLILSKEMYEPNTYHIFHLQSPTSKDFKYHPAMESNFFLWHNGMMDSREHGKYPDRPWDTNLLLQMIIKDGYINWEGLNDFKGSFSCILLIKGVGLYSFRNMIAPQYREGSSISSVRWDAAEKVEANVVYDLINDEILCRINNTYNPFGV